MWFYSLSISSKYNKYWSHKVKPRDFVRSTRRDKHFKLLNCSFCFFFFCPGATKDMGKMLGGEEEKDPDAAKKEEERQEALRQQEEERKAKHARMEAEREKVRQTIRDKVRNPSTSCLPTPAHCFLLALSMQGPQDQQDPKVWDLHTVTFRNLARCWWNTPLLDRQDLKSLKPSQPRPHYHLVD